MVLAFLSFLLGIYLEVILAIGKPSVVGFHI